VPPALQQCVHEDVAQARRRSGWPASETLAVLCIARRRYYRWLK
jgi:hypothetical protein